MNLENTVDEILGLDDKIRYVGIILKNDRFSRMSPHHTNLLTPEESEEYIDDSLEIWRMRMKNSEKLGNPLYSLTEYPKVIRVIVPLNTEGVVLVSLDTDGWHEVLVDEVLEIIDNSQDN